MVTNNKLKVLVPSSRYMIELTRAALVRIPRTVWSAKNVGRVFQRPRVGVVWFVLVHVQSGGANSSVLQSRSQRQLVHETASRRVYKERTCGSGNKDEEEEEEKEEEEEHEGEGDKGRTKRCCVRTEHDHLALLLRSSKGHRKQRPCWGMGTWDGRTRF